MEIASFNNLLMYLIGIRRGVDGRYLRDRSGRYEGAFQITVNLSRDINTLMIPGGN